MPAELAVSNTVLSVVPVSRVTVSVLPERIDSLAVAVMLIVVPALYVPLAFVDVNELIVGAEES